jgi:short-subunit dehydrogenase
MRIVTVGATSAMVEGCCRLWLAEQPCELVMVARNREKAEAIAADLRKRSPQSTVSIATVDFLDARAISRLADSIAADGPIDIVLIAPGWRSDQVDCQADLEVDKLALEINGVAPALFAEAFAGHLEKANRGTIAMISSAAGDRTHRRNYVYGAGKAMLSRYAEGMAHRFARTGVRVVLVKPSPTDSPMMADRKAAGRRLNTVESVARTIVAAIRKGQRMTYVPPSYGLFMLAFRNVPNFIMDRYAFEWRPEAKARRKALR